MLERIINNENMLVIELFDYRIILIGEKHFNLQLGGGFQSVHEID